MALEKQVAKLPLHGDGLSSLPISYLLGCYCGLLKRMFLWGMLRCYYGELDVVEGIPIIAVAPVGAMAMGCTHRSQLEERGSHSKSGHGKMSGEIASMRTNKFDGLDSRCILHYLYQGT